MSDTVRVKSSLMLPVSISEPLPKEFADKPGAAPALKTGVVRPGTNDVDADLWRAYSGADPKPSFVADGHIVEAPSEEEEEAGAGFGFEPALKAASTEGAAEGSTIKAAGPVSSADMKPTSNAPADDSPRSQPPSPLGNVAAAAPIASAVNQTAANNAKK